MKSSLLKNLAIFLVLLLICIPIIIPYLKSGYFPTHDGEWAVVRLADMFRTLRDLQFPPRYSGALNFGYGYPLFNFAYPFPYFLGIIFYFITHSFVLSIKSVFVLSVFLSSLFMYLASTKLWGSRISGIVSAIIYLYLPYRAVDLFVRGSIGESLALCLFPLIFYFSQRLFDAPFSRLNVSVLSILVGLLVLTHNIMTVLFIPLLAIFVITRIFHEKRFDVLQSFLLSIFLGAGVSFFFWFPALFEKSYIALSKIPIADRNLYFVTFERLFIPSWGYLPPTENGGFSYQLGIGQILVMVLSIFIVIISIIKTKFSITPAKFYALTLIIVYLLYFVLMFSITAIIWENVPLLKEINYPWTILSILGFITALISGFLVIEGKILKFLTLGIATVTFIITINYFNPVSYSNHPDSYYMTNEATTTSSDEYLPLWVKEKPTSRFNEKVDVVEGQAEISDVFYNSKEIRFSYKSVENPTFQVNTIYYPGWVAYQNGSATDISYDNPKGLMVIKADRYGDRVYLGFKETLPRNVANLVSIASLLVIAFIILRPILLFKK